MNTKLLKNLTTTFFADDIPAAGRYEKPKENTPVRPIASLPSKKDNTENISSLLRSVIMNNSLHSNPNYTSPACLPMDFFYVYQLLQENDHVEKSGHVSILI